jgi:membrane protein
MPDFSAVSDFLLHFRFVVVILVLAFIFLLMYTWMPSKKVRMRAQIPGALVAAVLWMLLSWIFSFYFMKGNFNTYGSLTTIILAMMWMFYCMYVILIGAYVNTHLIKHKHKQKTYKQ